MAFITRLTSALRFRRHGPHALMAAAFTTLIAAAPSAIAQNLIKDPFFANGVPADGSTDSFGTGYYSSNATAAVFDGVTGVLLSGSGGFFQAYPLDGYNPNGVDYVFSFLAAAVNTDVPTQILAEFGYTTDPNFGFVDSLTALNSGALTKLTVTGTSSSVRSPGFIYLQARQSGDVFVTGLDLEPAPLPAAGSGALSIAALLAGLAVHRFRRRLTA